MNYEHVNEATYLLRRLFKEAESIEIKIKTSPREHSEFSQMLSDLSQTSFIVTNPLFNPGESRFSKIRFPFQVDMEVKSIQ